MSEFQKAVRFWRCDFIDCRYEWQARADEKPPQCRKCGRRNWDGGYAKTKARLGKRVIPLKVPWRSIEKGVPEVSVRIPD